MGQAKNSETECWLDVMGPEMGDRRVRIPSEGVIVGRAKGCDIRVPEKSVSRRHLRFKNENTGCVVEDLGSHNGMLVNGKKVRRAELKDGDFVDIGVCKLLVTVNESRQDKAPAAFHIPILGNLMALLEWEGVHPLPVASALVVPFALWHWSAAVLAVAIAVLGMGLIRSSGHRGAVLCVSVVVLAPIAGWLNAGPLGARGAVRGGQIFCKENLRKIQQAIEVYRSQHACYPKNLQDLFAEYLDKESLHYSSSKDKNISCMLCDRGSKGCERTEIAVCILQKDKGMDQKGWVLRADGAIERIAQEKLENLMTVTRARNEESD
ncbi:MAG: FHA domain-containing protein [Candidatus Brocadiia bacterium]